MSLKLSSTVKYIAAGFWNDAEKLLKDFTQENSTEFPVFAEIWKKKNFVAIYLGREANELHDFTHEIFQLSLGYLEHTSLLRQVGAVYLLYALFRNQILKPPVRIRITQFQWVILREIQSKADEKNADKTLNYVMDYLYKNAFDFVVHATLYGPCSSKGKLELERPTFQSFLLKELKTGMANFHESNVLEDLKRMTTKYAKLRESIYSKEETIHQDAVKSYDKYMNSLDILVNDRPSNFIKRLAKRDLENIGSRRAQLKAKAFTHKAFFRQLNAIENDETETERSSPRRRKPLIRRRKRLPKEQRRVGRPRKVDLEKLLMEQESGNSTTSDEEMTHCIQKRGPAAKVSYLDHYDGLPSLPASIKKAELKRCTTQQSDSSHEEEEATEDVIREELRRRTTQQSDSSHEEEATREVVVKEESKEVDVKDEEEEEWIIEF